LKFVSLYWYGSSVNHFINICSAFFLFGLMMTQKSLLIFIFTTQSQVPSIAVPNSRKIVHILGLVALISITLKKTSNHAVKT